MLKKMRYFYCIQSDKFRLGVAEAHILLSTLIVRFDINCNFSPPQFVKCEPPTPIWHVFFSLIIVTGASTL